MAQEYNPLTQMNESITGNFYNYSIMLMMLASNMYQYVIRAVCDSYKLIPICCLVLPSLFSCPLSTRIHPFYHINYHF